MEISLSYNFLKYKFKKLIFIKQLSKGNSTFFKYAISPLKTFSQLSLKIAFYKPKNYTLHSVNEENSG